MRQILGYENHYSITKDGNVYSHKSGKIIKSTRDKNGYRLIKLCKNNIVKTYKVHRLVLQTYTNKEGKGLQVNHINAIKDDNRLENLEWCTNKQNIEHSHKMKLRKESDLHRKFITDLGYKNAKLTMEQIDWIKLNCIPKDKEYGFKAIGKRLNVSHSTVENVYKGKYLKRFLAHGSEKAIKELEKLGY